MPSNLLIYNRIWEIPMKGRTTPSELPADELRSYVNWSDQDEININKFIHNNKELISIYSKPAWYSFGNKSFKIIDVVVVSDQLDKGLEAFKKRKLKSDKIRGESKELTNKILPLLEKIPEISVAFGRGTVFNELRLPALYAHDIDIILFLNINFKEKSDLNNFISQLKLISKLFPNINFSVGIFDRMFNGHDEYLENNGNKESYAFAFDIISFPLILELKENIISYLKPYYIEALETGLILFDKTNGEFEKFKNEVISKYKLRLKDSNLQPTG